MKLMIILMSVLPFLVNAAPCSLTESNAVINNLACQVGASNNDHVGGGSLDVNLDELFGFDDWLYSGKRGPENEGLSLVNWQATSGALFGTISIEESVNDDYLDLMVVIKGGGGQTTQDNYIGYLLGEPVGTSGGWEHWDYLSPFFNSKNLQEAKDISHISLYLRASNSTVHRVSEPIIISLVGLLLIAIGLLRRYRA